MATHQAGRLTISGLRRFTLRARPVAAGDRPEPTRDRGGRGPSSQRLEVHDSDQKPGDQSGRDGGPRVHSPECRAPSVAWSGVRGSALSAEQRVEVGWLLTVEQLLKVGASLEVDGLRYPRS